MAHMNRPIFQYLDRDMLDVFEREYPDKKLFYKDEYIDLMNRLGCGSDYAYDDGHPKPERRMERQNDFDRFFTEIVTYTCRNTNVNPNYIKSIHIRLLDFKDPNKYDFIGIIDRTLNLDTITRIRELHNLHIYGFILLEKGECRIKPEIYSVNLICASPQRSVTNVSLGVSVMCMFLYALKAMFIANSTPDNQQEANLELASGFNNISGFLSYSSVGYKVDETLFDTCFAAPNLPMTANLSRINKEDFIQIVNGTERQLIASEELDDRSSSFEIYKTFPPETNDQRILQTRCNNLLQNEFVKRRVGHIDHDHYIFQLENDLSPYKQCLTNYVTSFTDISNRIDRRLEEKTQRQLRKETREARRRAEEEARRRAEEEARSRDEEEDMEVEDMDIYNIPIPKIPKIVPKNKKVSKAKSKVRKEVEDVDMPDV